MKINRDTLPSMADWEHFLSVYSDYAVQTLHDAYLFPQLSRPRLFDAHHSWQHDVKMIGNYEPHLDEGLDHFKQAGHLAFWLRRMNPLVETTDMAISLADPSENKDLTKAQEGFRDLLFSAANEYLAFDFGYQLCRYYEASKSVDPAVIASKNLSQEYYQTVCHFMKFKSVSPHALFLIYKSLFS